MADINITIGTPTLQVGEVFRVRHRSYPSGSFGAPVNQTNAPFAITGLTAGEYEIEIVHVLADGTLCPATYRREVIPVDFNCWDFLAQMIEDPLGSGLYFIKMDFSGSPQPPCGWMIKYGNQTYTTPQLSGSSIKIPSPNVSTNVTVLAQLCNGLEKECYTITVNPIPPIPSPCVPVTIMNAFIDYQVRPWGVEYYISVYFLQSNPNTLDAHFVWQQTGTPFVPGSAMDAGSYIQAGYLFSASGAQRFITFKVTPTQTAGGVITYTVRMLDKCGTWHNMTATTTV